MERGFMGFFVVLMLGSIAMLGRSFYYANAVEVPVQGGTYIEGSIGEILPINPWFTRGNDVNRDIASLVFAGLLRYDPKTGNIVEDLATMKVSPDGLLYTLTLKDDLYWHDHSETNIHPVTSADIAFTYETIINPLFPNPLLRQNFKGVELEVVDEKTVRFRLKKAYAFFPSNLTLGLLPRRAFDGIPIDTLDQTTDFGLHPIGSGPYSFLNLVQTDFSTEVTLRRFERKGFIEPKLDRIVFRVYPDYSTLLSDIGNISGIRAVRKNEDGQLILPAKFTPIHYSLPQYVGLFFNLDRPVVQDRMLRLGLQLATNKQEIVDTLHESVIVDTPLLELDTKDWRYTFDAAAAQGALFESSWHMPEKIRLQRLLEQRDANTLGGLKNLPSVVLLDTGATLTLTGAMKDLKTTNISINNIAIEKNGGGTGTWIVKLPSTKGSTGALKIGLNILRIIDTKDTILDSAFVERVTDITTFKRAIQEQSLVDDFLASKNLPAGDPKKLTINQLYIGPSGYLRRKLPGEPVHTRTKEDGTPLHLTLLTSRTPETYPKIAEMIAEQWRKIGVDVTVIVPKGDSEVLSKKDIEDARKEFEERLLRRDYDVVLFGESLLDNLDSYPFWHSSKIQEFSSDARSLKLDATNLSQYASFEADTLLTKIRETNKEDLRERALEKLNEVLARDVPAIFLYSPLYAFAHDATIQGIDLHKLSLHSDRFLTLEDWYIATTHELRPDASFLDFFPWLLRLGRN